MRNLIRYLILSIFLCSYVKVNALNVQIIQAQCHETSIQAFYKRIPFFEKYGITFVDYKPDVILILGTPSKKMLLSLKHPVIILDKEESASISRAIRNCLANSTVKAVFKNTVLRDKKLYNQATQNKYHFNIINEPYRDTKKEQFKKLNQYELRKITCVLWDTYRSPFRDDFNFLKEDYIDFSGLRTHDLFFAGTVNDKRAPGLHRIKALEAIAKIRNCTVIAQNGRLPKNEYYALLKTTKIAVSPWGNGEWCWRDFEAIYSGAIVIKPDTSFVQMLPDLYQNNRYYVSCKSDFSDLSEKVSFVLNNYESFADMRRNAQALLVNYWDDEKIAYNFVEAIKRTINWKSKKKRGT